MTLTIPVKIAKMGNSLRMTIPVPVARTLNFRDGDMLEVGVKEGLMIVRKAMDSSQIKEGLEDEEAKLLEALGVRPRNKTG